MIYVWHPSWQRPSGLRIMVEFTTLVEIERENFSFYAGF